MGQNLPSRKTWEKSRPEAIGKFRPNLPKRAWFHALRKLGLFGVAKHQLCSKGLLRLLVQYYYMLRVCRLTKSLLQYSNEITRWKNDHIGKGICFSMKLRRRMSASGFDLLGRIARVNLNKTFCFTKARSPFMDSYVKEHGDHALRRLFKYEESEKPNWLAGWKDPSRFEVD